MLLVCLAVGLHLLVAMHAGMVCAGQGSCMLGFHAQLLPSGTAVLQDEFRTIACCPAFVCSVLLPVLAIGGPMRCTYALGAALMR